MISKPNVSSTFSGNCICKSECSPNLSHITGIDQLMVTSRSCSGYQPFRKARMFSHVVARRITFICNSKLVLGLGRVHQKIKENKIRVLSHTKDMYCRPINRPIILFCPLKVKNPRQHLNRVEVWTLTCPKPLISKALTEYLCLYTKDYCPGA